MTRAVNFLCAIDNTTFYKLEKMLEDDDLIGDAGMTCQKSVELSLLAEQRIKERTSAMAVAKRIRTKGEKKDAKAQKKGEGDKDKGKDKDKGNDDAPKRDDRARNPLSTLTFLEVPKELKGLAKEESIPLTKSGNFNKQLPRHRLQECPYTGTELDTHGLRTKISQ